MKIKINKFENFYKKPERNYYNDAGADVFSTIDLTLEPFSTNIIPLGFGVEIPDGFVGMIIPRSSYAQNALISQIPAIDAGYRGEIHCILYNASDKQKEIKRGDRIGSLLIFPILVCDFETEMPRKRESNSFGSSGK